MLLGDKWVELLGGKKKLWRLCNAESIYAEILEAKQKISNWVCEDDEMAEDGWGTSSRPQEVRRPSFKWSELMNIGDEEVKWDQKEVGKKSTFPEMQWRVCVKMFGKPLQNFLIHGKKFA